MLARSREFPALEMLAMSFPAMDHSRPWVLAVGVQRGGLGSGALSQKNRRGSWKRIGVGGCWKRIFRSAA